ncbi:malate synthase [Halopolyspora algeriensis]|uniref:Malate synthase n=1 Tax=Halopolyspora algeriensis TaxID=1500506 RepID=A0A368VZ68_9ACTN|nr:malate synthase A [Halopolyspora algeriensis]RCW46719.1 malate synthase [Halopolyspora algeriensis]TQM46744.1 malate synthase [Halopolyspora algeriensis]
MSQSTPSGSEIAQGVQVLGGAVERGDEILTPEALDFVARLQRSFGSRRDELLERRKQRRAEAARNGKLDFLESTREIRESDWQVAEAPAALQDRRVEITGPTDRKMSVNALNSGARVWLADLEDANTPHWSNVVSGQVNLYDVIRKQVELTTPEGKQYKLRDDIEHAVPLVRPRGWHFDERHILIDGKPAVGALVDFGLYFFHNAHEGLERGSGPYFYLPKMESHLEARLWNDVFVQAQQELGVPHGSVRATVLIETIPAAFEMEEILYELRDHSGGLNAGRWDYLFSVIKTFRESDRYILPDRNSVTMTAPFMRAYTELLVRTCHKRGAFAIGGMAAFIPNRRDPEVTEKAMAKIHDDKNREAADGFDGSWVAHPDTVSVCKEEFDAVLGDKPNQLDRKREDVSVTAEDLLDVAATPGARSIEGLRSAVDIGVRYIVSWLGGNGAAGIHNMMEDAATAEISRSQLWQWLHNDVVLADGRQVTKELVREVLADTEKQLRSEEGFPVENLGRAVELFERVAVADEFADFLTLPAYEYID